MLPNCPVAGQVVGSNPLVDNARYQIGKTCYEEAYHTEAITHFEWVHENWPGSDSADGAQYYLGRCHQSLVERGGWWFLPKGPRTQTRP